MSHGHVDSLTATAQNAVTDPESGPSDQPRGEQAEAPRETVSYAAEDLRNASLAAPAAGEVGDYADLDEPSGGMAQGRTHTNREAHAHRPERGPETRAANKAGGGNAPPDRGAQ